MIVLYKPHYSSYSKLLLIKATYSVSNILGYFNSLRNKLRNRPPTTYERLRYAILGKPVARLI